jgi:hypothetical protein
VSGDTYHQDRSDAWGAVCEALSKTLPNWHLLAPTGMDAAVAAVKELAEKAKRYDAIKELTK